MQIGVVGTSHKSATLALREKLACVSIKRFSSYCVHLEHSFVLLSTCNRTEIYFSSSDLALTHSYILQILRQEMQDEFEAHLYSYFGIDCFYHLAKVTAGLDSAVLFETEIQGQVKCAYESALFCTKELHFLFQKSLKVAKEIRNRFPTHPSTLEKVVTDLVKQYGGKKILFVGASQINCTLAQNLKEYSLTFCSRTARKHILPLEERLRWTEYDTVIVATKACHYLITLTCVMQPKLLIDLSVPRNIDPALASSCYLYNIDEIHRLIKTKVHNLEAIEDYLMYLVRVQMASFVRREAKILHFLDSAETG